MDEQENGKIGFNYVHFLFSIATSEKDKKRKELKQVSMYVTTFRMNGVSMSDMTRKYIF